MKKLMLSCVLAVIALSFAAAEDIDLGNFPVGKWVDEQYNAVWTFSTGNIQLYMTDGSLVFDFDGKVEDFNVGGSLSGVEITFSCDETGRKYKFVKGVSNLDLEMIIDRDNGIHYETKLSFQK